MYIYCVVTERKVCCLHRASKVYLLVDNLRAVAVTAFMHNTHVSGTSDRVQWNVAESRSGEVCDTHVRM